MEFPDAKKDVDTKNVGNKGILDTMHTASEKASGKRVFSTPQARVIQPALGIGQIKLKIHLIPDAMQKLKLKGKGRREKRRGFSVCSSPPSVPSSLPSLTVPLLSATLVMVAFFVLNLFLFGMAILQLWLCWLSYSYGSLCSLEGFVRCEDFEEGSADMRWHRDKHVKTDDVLRHPADAEGWKHFDSEFPDFAFNPRNVHLGLASDSPKSPVREIDVYLQPLTVELKELWTFGVRAYDSLTAIMSSSYPRNNFMETDAMFLEFEDDLDNITGASLSVGDNTGSSSQQPATPTLRRCAQSRLLELERHVAINECTPMTIAPGAEKHIFSHVVGFSQAIGMCRLFMLDFNDQAMNRFVEHQMLTTFKEFQADCHRHFKKYNDPEEARANPPNALEQSRTNKAARQKQPYNHSSESKSFLQRQPQRMRIRSGYLKGLGWGPKPKARRTTSASSSSTSCSQSTQKVIELQAKLNEALKWIEVQDRNHQVLASQVEQMQKLIEEFTRAQQGPP
ncbi:CACTA en-spm transposon protein [Cucumis melo var. makuwa]|uniref:CACTA en-spm transposon protein n=1 Tax=Cucumis melo var. makuwa TaxID=1194695 RepID=A0A5A7UL05_CUCMM|nr:CACTA en-spm transposon protein [Cucumis melo var. makuwa]